MRTDSGHIGKCDAPNPQLRVNASASDRLMAHYSYASPAVRTKIQAASRAMACLRSLSLPLPEDAIEDLCADMQTTFIHTKYYIIIMTRMAFIYAYSRSLTRIIPTSGVSSTPKRIAACSSFSDHPSYRPTCPSHPPASCPP